MQYVSYNIPLLLTLFRLLIAPVFIPVLIVLYLPLNNNFYQLITGILFFIVCITDFLDGYLARKYNQETVLGKLLDPLADKFLLGASVIALVSIHKIYFIWAIIFLLREFFVMGLREIALYYGFSVPVSPLGKLKTIFQHAYLTYIIIMPSAISTNLFNVWFFEQLLLLAALILTIYSAYDYAQAFQKSWNTKINSLK
jgi:CDP-diacylglycerol--glycerol-3-phosphate 3-phosphatidyltransferase